MRYHDFALSVEEYGNEYIAHVTKASGGVASTVFRIPFEPPDLERIYDTIEIAVLRGVGRTSRRVGEPGLERLRTFGSKLFDAVFSGPVRDVYINSLINAEKREAGLRIKLQITTSLGQLPWEFLYDSSHIQDFLLLSRWTPVVRFVDLPKPPRPLQITPPLRVLLVLASPRSLPSLNIINEHALIRQSIYNLEAQGLLELDVIAGPSTLDKMRRQLLKKNYHVLHIVAHGDFDERHQEGIILLEDLSGDVQQVGAEQMARLLRNTRSVRLVLLNSCRGTVQSSSQPFTSSALALVQTGIPAVVAMQFEIKDEDAVIFAHSFYDAIVNDYPVDAAISEARLTLALKNPDSVAWATPVLFMRSTTGKLFQFKSEIPDNKIRLSSLAASVRREISKSDPDEEDDVIPELSYALSFEEWVEQLHLVRIPAGKFSMGGQDPDAQPDEQPVHDVELGEYYIGRFPVTNELYAEFIRAKPDYPVPSAPDTWAIAQPLRWDTETRMYQQGRKDHPVALVNWDNAVAYCKWLQSISGLEFRLPTEAEWEKAAKGPNHTVYPWGNEWNDQLCNAGLSVGSTTPVGLYSPAGDSGYGISEMAGNVWEWCSSLYRPYPYSHDDGREDPTSTDNRVLRGGSWIYSPQDARCTARNPLHTPGEIGIDGGFRLVLVPPNQ